MVPSYEELVRAEMEYLREMKIRKLLGEDTDDKIERSKQVLDMHKETVRRIKIGDIMKG